MSEVVEGELAPDFTLPGDGGADVTLSDLRGAPVVLYFYPKDNTSGCTKEAVAFNTLLADFDAAGVTIVGISPDPVASHDRFKSKLELKFRLLSDEAQEVSSLYGVWKEKSMYGKTYMGVERSTFLIDKDGKIVKAWRKVRVPGHAEAVLDEVRELA